MSASLNDQLEAFFRARPDVWFDGMAIATAAGKYAWRSRISDVRKRGLRIDNRQRRMTNNAGKPYVVSEYRYVPVSLLDLVEQPTA